MANGLQFFNLQKLGFVPLDCWGEECETEPKLRGKHFDPNGTFFAPDRKTTSQNRANLAYEMERREGELNLEEVLVAEAEAENDPDMLDKADLAELGETRVCGQVRFSLEAAKRLAQKLGYPSEARTDELTLVLGHYLAEKGDHRVRGMDGVIELVLKFAWDEKIVLVAVDFTERMALLFPRISPKMQKRLVDRAQWDRRKKGNEKSAANRLGIILFGKSRFERMLRA